MLSPSDLMGLGFSAPQATAIGDPINAAVTGVGTAQSGAAALSLGITPLTTAGGTTAFVLPSTAPLGEPIYVVTTTATTALVYGPTGYNINGGSDNASVSVAQGKGAMFMRISSTRFFAIVGA